MFDPRIYEVIERALRAIARVFPRGDVPKIGAIAIICSTMVVVTLIASDVIDLSKNSAFVALGGWALSNVVIVWLCR
jgi:hypothetical protein